MARHLSERRGAITLKKADNLALLVFALWVSNATLSQTQPTSQNHPEQDNVQRVRPSVLPSDIDPQDPAISVWSLPVGGPQTIAKTVPANSTSPDVQGITKNGSDFVMKTQVDEVVLPVTVVNRKQHLVTSLEQKDFVIYEDERPQRITGFRCEDVPVSIGILVDNSGSMRQKRAAVTQAVVNLVKSSNPKDEVFIVNFNDHPYLDQDFTADINLMHEALARLDSRNGTALYDAVFVAAQHLDKGAHRQKRILLVITDGEDNESRMTLDQTIRSVQNNRGPVIYSIGILGTTDRERGAQRALEALSTQTGGAAFFPKGVDEVDEVSQAVARDIRNQYTIAYKSTSQQTGDAYHKIKVLTPGFKDLQVRTKSGYFAGQQRALATAR